MASKKEATARIKINKLLEAAGWRFFAEGKSPANIQLEPSITIKAQDLDALGVDFEKSSKGFIDFLLLNEKGFPFIVLEAKAEDKSPLVGKEQARKYARSQNCRFIILSNGNLHYFWDLERGNPYVITTFPTPTSVMGYQKTVPDPKRLVEEVVDDDYIVLTQRPGYLTGPADFGPVHPVVSKWTENPKVVAQHGDILVTVKGSGLGKVNQLNIPAAAISRQLMAVRVSSAFPAYIHIVLSGKFDHFQALAEGAAIPGITRDHVLELPIPLPPLATQQAIVAEIEAEQALDAANHELITRFEKKIQATLARIWGES